jgi:Ca2+-transporting ATPase
LKTSILCNNVILNAEELRGDSIELALIQFAEKLKFDSIKIKQNNPEKLEIPFNTSSKLMATLNKNEANGFTFYVKGAFESVIKHCNTVLKDNKPQKFNTKKNGFNVKMS